MSIAQLDTLYEAAVAAMDAGSFDTAILKLMAIKVRLATTPNLSKSLGGGGASSITWNAAEIDTLIGQCHQMKALAAHATSGPFRQTKVAYARAGIVE
jgi:hypothetical protein